jgi:hypothetical protein
MCGGFLTTNSRKWVHKIIIMRYNGMVNRQLPDKKAPEVRYYGRSKPQPFLKAS